MNSKWTVIFDDKQIINQSIKNDSIKRQERIKNIDLEVENWRNLKSN